MNRRVAVRGIILDDDGKIFFVRIIDKHTKQPLEHLALPGGGLDPGEPMIEGLHREMIEETNVAPQIGRLLYIQQYVDKGNGDEQMEFFFHITNTADYKDIDLSSASHAADEIAEHDFIDPKQVFVLPKLLAEEDIVQHIVGNHPVKIFNYI